jgi:adenylate cyclase
MTDATRKLATIVALDVAGYSARTEADEARTTAEVATLRKVIEGIATKHGGRVFNTAGDGFMLEFGSSLAAVEAAFELAETCEPKVRVGVHLGDVAVQPNGDLLGHGVNVAARLMAQSAPGAALVSATVRQTIRGPLAERLVSRGVLKLDKMAETIEAFARGAASMPPSPATEPKSVEPVLTVLPFDNLSTDPEMQFFSDGVSEEIIQRLSRGAKLKVIGRTSSFQFRGDKKGDAARVLKCSHVLDGSVRRAGARVRIAAHLVEASSHTTLWSDRYDRGLEDTFAVQDEISEAIADALHQTFTSFSTKAIDPAVYDLYLRASAKSFAPDEFAANIVLLEQATRRAPHFAEAWGRLAFTRGWLRFYEPYATRRASAALITQEADRALAIDPQNADALLARFFVIPPYGRFIEAEAAMAQIRRSSSPDKDMFSCRFLRATGYVREGADVAERAFRLNALDPPHANMLALGMMATGRVRESAAVLEGIIDRAPGMSFPVANLMRAYAFLGEWDAIDKLLDPAANRPLREFQEGLSFINTKRNPTPENLTAWRGTFEAYAARTGCIDVSRLVYAAHLGLADAAYDVLDKAYLGPRGNADDVMGVDGYTTGMLFWEIMPEIRHDKRFVKLCARLGLVELWLATQKWPDCAGEVPYDFRAECEKARDIPKESYNF